MKIRTMCGWVSENKIWIPSYDKNILFCSDNAEGFCEMVCGYEKEIFRDVRKMYNYNNKLYFFSPYRCVMGIYDIYEGIISTYVYNDKTYVQIAEILFDDQKCWVVPSNLMYPIIEINLIDMNTREICLNVNNRHVTRGVVCQGKIIIADGSEDNPFVSIIDTETDEVKTYKLSILSKIDCVTMDSESFYVLGSDNISNTYICVYDSCSGRFLKKIICDFDIDRKLSTVNYIRMFVFNDQLFLVSNGMFTHKIISLIEKSKIEMKNNCNVEDNNMAFEVQQVDNVLYIFIRNRNVIGIINMLDCAYKEIYLSASVIKGDMMGGISIRNESEFDTLEDYIDSLKGGDQFGSIFD